VISKVISKRATLQNDEWHRAQPLQFVIVSSPCGNLNSIEVLFLLGIILIRVIDIRNEVIILDFDFPNESSLGRCAHGFLVTIQRFKILLRANPKRIQSRALAVPSSALPTNVPSKLPSKVCKPSLCDRNSPTEDPAASAYSPANCGMIRSAILALAFCSADLPAIISLKSISVYF
jgi:hypothetical protein